MSQIVTISHHILTVIHAYSATVCSLRFVVVYWGVGMYHGWK